MSFYMTRVYVPETAAIRPPPATNVNVPSRICGCKFGPIRSHLTKNDPLQVIHHPLSISTGAARFGVWTFRNPPVKFVLERAIAQVS